MLTVTKTVEVEAEVEVEIELDDIVEAIREAGDELELIGKLVDDLGPQDTLQVMHFCMERLHRHI